jgi:hypothetical protein
MKQPLVLVDGRAIQLQPTPDPRVAQPITIGPANVNLALPGLLGALLAGNTGNGGLWGDKFRYLGPITALMTIRESGTDTLQITQHPVAAGAQITDHSFMDPARLDLTMMATNAQSQPWGEDYVTTVYQKLRDLQSSRLKFPIQTGKRLYQNMLISSISMTNDQSTEHALMLQISCQEVIIVETPAVASPTANQTAPQKTAGVSQGGPKQAVVTSIVPTGIVLQPPLPPL